MQGRGASSIYDPKNKWLAINQLMRDDKISILALQETHLNDDMRQQIESLHHHIKIFASSHPDRPNAMGVAIVINKRLIASNEATATTLIEGRAIMANVPWHNGESIKILNIYAPNNQGDNSNFWKDLDKHWSNPLSQLPFPDVMLGDFNMCESPSDRVNFRSEEGRILNAFNELKITLGLQDGWRYSHPDEILYTLTHRANNGHLSRLDRIYLSPDLINRTEKWSHDQPPVTSDHKIVTTTIEKKNAPYIGKGRWQIPPHVLLNHTFIQKIEAVGISALNEIKTLDEIPNARSEEHNAQTIMESFKKEIIKMARKIAVKPIHPLDKRLKELELSIKMISNDLGMSQEEKILSLTLLEEERCEVTAKSFMAKRLKINTRNRVEGETISKYWVNLNKPKKPRDTILRLKTPPPPNNPHQETSYVTRSEEMVELAANYHANIQLRDLGANENQREQAIQNSRNSINKKINAAQANEHEEEINRLDVEIALASAANGKASGLDGIPYELWKILRDRHTAMEKLNEPAFDIILFLQLTFNDIERNSLHQNSQFNDGWLCPIFKKGDTADIANYRPITVLNTEYKLITKSLQAKLARIAPDLIHEDQAGFMKNRSITDHIKTIRIISEYAEITEELNRAIVALDQEKAYDRIRHDYIWEILEEMGIPPKFSNTIKSLYKNAKTKVMLNGVLSNYFHINRGVRQGDPLSCLLFNLAIEPLANCIRASDLKGIDIPKTKRKLKVLLFADDTTIFIKNSDSFETLNIILDNWCLASGAKFNKGKTEIIPIGSQAYKDELRESRKISDREPPLAHDIHILEKDHVARILGASVGDNNRDDIPWAKATEKVTAQLANWNRSNPTIEGRRLSTQMMVGGITQFLAKAQGMPPQVEKGFEKIIKKYTWNADKAKIGMDRLNTPHEVGGRKILDIKKRNKAISATNIKTYLRMDENRPAWAFFYDEFIRKAYDKNVDKYANDDPRINPIIQSWPAPNNMRSLPKEVKALVSDLKTLHVTLDCQNASNEAKGQVPIWLHPKIAPNAKQETFSKKSVHLRKTHNIKTVDDTINLATILLDPHHRNHPSCKCQGCERTRQNTDCTSPNSCATHANKLINKIDRKWLPGSNPSGPPNPANPLLTNTPSNVYECYRILTDNQKPIETHPAKLTQRGLRRIFTIYTDGSCDRNGDDNAKAGSGIFYHQNDARNKAVRVPRKYGQSNQTGELFAIKTAIDHADPNAIIEIKTDSQYAIDALTKHFKTWENQGWSGIQNASIIKDTINSLRAHQAPISFTWVKGHAGIEGNDKADQLAKEGTQKEYPPETPDRHHNTIPPGARIADITQAIAYRELIDKKPQTKERSTDTNIARIQQDLQLTQDQTPPVSTIWRNLQKTKIVYRTQREFLYKTIKNAQMIGERWEHIPQYEHRAQCEHCNSTENMEHILTRCDIPGQNIAWQIMGELWERKFPGEWTRSTYGEIIGITSTSKKTNDKHNKGKTRLFQILISEIAYIIWTL